MALIKLYSKAMTTYGIRNMGGFKGSESGLLFAD